MDLRLILFERKFHVTYYVVMWRLFETYIFNLCCVINVDFDLRVSNFAWSLSKTLFWYLLLYKKLQFHKGIIDGTALITLIYSFLLFRVSTEYIILKVNCLKMVYSLCMINYLKILIGWIHLSLIVVHAEWNKCFYQKSQLYK